MITLEDAYKALQRASHGDIIELPPPSAGTDRSALLIPTKVWTGKRYAMVRRLFGDTYEFLTNV